MRHALGWLITGIVSVILITAPALARAGGGRSFGRGFGRSSGMNFRPRPSTNPYPLSQPQQDYRAPVSPTPSPSPNPSPAYRPEPQASQTASRGGFLRGMAGGIAGGFLGSMLFNSVGRAMGGGYGPSPMIGGAGGTGGGFGLMELLLLAGLGYLGYRYFRTRQSAPVAASPDNQVLSFRMPPVEIDQNRTQASDPIDGDTASDIFFRIQGAWTRRDLSSVRDLLGDEVRSHLQSDLDQLRSQGQINRLENISVRQVEIGETWREGDFDLTTVRFHANLLDYTVDEASQKVLAGSDSLPVKFVEDWTFARRGSSTLWQVVGISQIQ